MYSLISDTEPSKQTDQIMGMFAKDDIGYDDMVDGIFLILFLIQLEMNEKYVQSKDIDDFSGLEDLLFNVYSIKQSSYAQFTFKT